MTAEELRIYHPASWPGISTMSPDLGMGLEKYPLIVTLSVSATVQPADKDQVTVALLCCKLARVLDITACFPYGPFSLGYAIDKGAVNR